MVAVTLEQAKDYLKLDFDEPSLPDLVEASQIYIDYMVGEAYKSDEKAVKLADFLQKKIINDMFENRSTEVSSEVKQDRITTSILDKLSNYD